MANGLKRAFKLSGSSVRPAYPGFIVMNVAQVGTSLISLPSNMNSLACLSKRGLSKEVTVK